jgi:hypothetical protein
MKYARVLYISILAFAMVCAAVWLNPGKPREPKKQQPAASAQQPLADWCERAGGARIDPPADASIKNDEDDDPHFTEVSCRFETVTGQPDPLPTNHQEALPSD